MATPNRTVRFHKQLPNIFSVMRLTNGFVAICVGLCFLAAAHSDDTEIKAPECREPFITSWIKYIITKALTHGISVGTIKPLCDESELIKNGIDHVIQSYWDKIKNDEAFVEMLKQQHWWLRSSPCLFSTMKVLRESRSCSRHIKKLPADDYCDCVIEIFLDNLMKRILIISFNHLLCNKKIQLNVATYVAVSNATKYLSDDNVYKVLTKQHGVDHPVATILDTPNCWNKEVACLK